jgi:3-deoxy-manno-octulosonate cytidylyltransferase (CMP-KDO synthetase)
VTTLKIRATPEEVASRTANKVVTNVHGDALYFSRLPIPFDRDNRGGITYWKHIGLYAYRRSVLEAYHTLPPSGLERAEQLEQLRALENGHRIRCAKVEGWLGIPVDVPADVARVEARLRELGRC